MLKRFSKVLSMILAVSMLMSIGFVSVMPVSVSANEAVLHAWDTSNLAGAHQSWFMPFNERLPDTFVFEAGVRYQIVMDGNFAGTAPSLTFMIFYTYPDTQARPFGPWQFDPMPIGPHIFPFTFSADTPADSMGLHMYVNYSSATIFNVPEIRIELADHPNATPSPPPEFRIVDGVLTEYNGTGGVVAIPFGVTAIADGVFAGKGVTRITIPSSVTSIGASAFEDNLLESVVIPRYVHTIGDRAFAGASNLERVTFLSAAPPTVGIDVFYGVAYGAIVIVPRGANAFGIAGGNWHGLIVAAAPDPNLLARSDFGDLPIGSVITQWSGPYLPTGMTNALLHFVMPWPDTGARGTIDMVRGSDTGANAIRVSNENPMYIPELAIGHNYLMINRIESNFGKRLNFPNMFMGNLVNWTAYADSWFADSTFDVLAPSRNGGESPVVYNAIQGYRGRVGHPGTTMWVSVIMDPAADEHMVFALPHRTGFWGIHTPIAVGSFAYDWCPYMSHASSNGNWGLHASRLYGEASLMDGEMPPDGTLRTNARWSGDGFINNWHPAWFNPVDSGIPITGEPTLVVLRIDFEESWGSVNDGNSGFTLDDGTVIPHPWFGNPVFPGTTTHRRGATRIPYVQTVWRGTYHYDFTGGNPWHRADLQFLQDFFEPQGVYVGIPSDRPANMFPNPVPYQGENVSFARLSEEISGFERPTPSTVYMFINPDLSLGEPSVEDADAYVATILDLGFGAWAMHGGNGRRMDEVRIGLTFDSVAPMSRVGRPIPNIAPGRFDEPVEITLTSRTEGARIYYTLDGSEPIAGESYLFDPNSPILVEYGETVTVRAVAVSDCDLLDSYPFEGVYRALTLLPIVISLVENGQTTATVTVFDEDFEEDVVLILAAFEVNGGQERFIHANSLMIENLSINTPLIERTLVSSVPSSLLGDNIEFRPFLWNSFMRMMPFDFVLE